MNRDILNKLKISSFFLLLIIGVEIFYIFYSLSYSNTKSFYFAGINDISKKKDSFITVGSNNNNGQYYEKAEFSRYNKNLEKLFGKIYNVGYNSSFFGVSFDGDNIVAVGNYEKTKKEHISSVRRGLIVKYDAYGDIIFENDFQILDNTKFTNIVVVEDGYLVTGQSVYSSTKIGSEVGGAILVKYSKEGKLLWSKTFGSNKSAIFNNLLIVDNFIFTVGFNENGIGVLCKYDLNGNLITYSEYSYMDDIGFVGIVCLDGRIYVSGAKQKKNFIKNALIAVYDFDCSYLKEVVYDSNDSMRYDKLVVDNHNFVIAIGNSFNQNDFYHSSSFDFNYDGVIGKYDVNLKEISVVTYGDERDDCFTDVYVSGNQYLVAGYSSYEDGSYMSKFIHYSDALKVLTVD